MDSIRDRAVVLTRDPEVVRTQVQEEVHTPDRVVVHIRAQAAVLIPGQAVVHIPAQVEGLIRDRVVVRILAQEVLAIQVLEVPRMTNGIDLRLIADNPGTFRYGHNDFARKVAVLGPDLSVETLLNRAYAIK